MQYTSIFYVSKECYDVGVCIINPRRGSLLLGLENVQRNLKTKTDNK